MLELNTFLKIEFTGAAKKLFWGAWVVMVHAGFIFFLHSWENVPLSSYLLTILSAAWFLLWIFCDPIRRHQGLFIMGLAIISLIQPLDVLHYFRTWDNAAAVPRQHPYYAMNFAYERPAVDSAGIYDNCYEYPKFRIDDTGFCVQRYYGQRNFYLLKENVRMDVLKNYVRHKFVLYQSVSGMDYSKPNWSRIESALSGNNGQAVVDSAEPDMENASASGLPKFVSGADDQLRVVRFEANRIALVTHFSKKTFLVYNDNFHDQWRVFIDGHLQRLYRANYAFKGVWVDEGRHRVEFVFGNWVENAFYFSLIFVMFGLLVFIIFGFLRTFLKKV
jgi:hypothetical protein